MKPPLKSITPTREFQEARGVEREKEEAVEKEREEERVRPSVSSLKSFWEKGR